MPMENGQRDSLESGNPAKPHIANPGGYAQTGRMVRCIAILLSLAFLVGTFESATHFEPLGAADTAHELHAEFHGNPDAPDADGDSSSHFCHCAAHSPAMIAAFEWPMLPRLQRAVPTIAALHASGMLKPPLRPPNLV